MRVPRRLTVLTGCGEDPPGEPVECVVGHETRRLGGGADRMQHADADRSQHVEKAGDASIGILSRGDGCVAFRPKPIVKCVVAGPADAERVRLVRELAGENGKSHASFPTALRDNNRPGGRLCDAASHVLPPSG